MKWGDQKVFQTNFSYTKAHAHGQAPSNGAFSKSMVRELQVSNKQNNNNDKTDKMGSFSGLSTQYADNSKVSQGYQ